MVRGPRDYADRVIDRGAQHARAWAASLDPSRHNPFGSLRLRAEFETSSEIFGCSLDELRDALAAAIGPDLPRKERPASPLEALRDRIRRRGHPDFRE